MSDQLEEQAPGWYPDPDAENTERWWGGTDWTANTRPLNGIPAAAPHPPVPGAVTYAGAPGQPVDAPVQPTFRRGHNRIGIWMPLTFIGLVFTVLGFSINAAMSTPTNMSATTTGTVVSVQLSSGTRTNRSCTSLAAFEVGGETYLAAPSGRVSPCPWAVGQSVAVAYDPTSTAEAMVPGAGWVQYLTLGFACFGVLALTGGLFAFVRSGAGRSFLRLRRRTKATTPAQP